MKEKKLEVIVVNNPSAERSKQKAKELCEFLQKTWPSSKKEEGRKR